MTTFRRPAAALAIAAGLTGAGIATASAAAAAGPPAGAVVCFVHPNGVAYTGPVFAQVAAPGGWQNVAEAASMNGCTTWTLAAGATWRFEAVATAYRTVFEGASAPITMYASGSYDFGTWTVGEAHF